MIERVIGHTWETFAAVEAVIGYKVHIGETALREDRVAHALGLLGGTVMFLCRKKNDVKKEMLGRREKLGKKLL